MFTISKASEYAILVLASLDNSKHLSLREIAVTYSLPFKYLEKVASRLKENHLLDSKEGFGGGYILARNARTISLTNIIEAIEGKKGLVSCLHGNCLSEKNCFYKSIWQRLQSKIDNEFDKIKLADLLEEK
jgi:Rrf2 family protein